MTARLFADLEGDVLLGELELPDQLRVTLGFLQGIEVLALQILDEGQLEDGAIIGLADDDGHVRQTQELGCPPAPLAGDEFEMAVAFADDQRLDDSLFADGVREFAQRFGAKSLRGCSGQGRMRSSGTRSTRPRGSAAAVAAGAGMAAVTGDSGGAMPTAGAPPSRAPKPRPKAGLAMRPECRREARMST